jgi:hypothetical protein
MAQEMPNSPEFMSREVASPSWDLAASMRELSHQRSDEEESLEEQRVKARVMELNKEASELMAKALKVEEEAQQLRLKATTRKFLADSMQVAQGYPALQYALSGIAPILHDAAPEQDRMQFFAKAMDSSADAPQLVGDPHKRSSEPRSCAETIVSSSWSTKDQVAQNPQSCDSTAPPINTVSDIDTDSEDSDDESTDDESEIERVQLELSANIVRQILRVKVCQRAAK